MIYIPATQFKTIGPEKKKYSMGITSMQALVNGDVLIGTGEGKIHITEKETFKPLKYDCIHSINRNSNVFCKIFTSHG
jgi:hypothetical protein